jgi:hypothetical protein
MHRIWSDGENRHSFAFGASLAESQDPAWRQFVDSM